MKDLDKYRGCLVGGAAGDALGYPIEFFDEEYIFQKYGSAGITEYELCDGVAQISDDTQMTLFTANALLVNKTRLCTRGIAGPWQSMAAFCYYDWYKTQTKEYPVDIEHPYSWSWLLNIPELFNRRAPGATCLAASSELISGDPNKASNYSKGCGGVMRIAPVGLYFGGSNKEEEEIDKIGADIAAVTHGHELGYIPAAALTHIIMRIAHKGDDIEKAVQAASDVIEKMYPKSKYAPILCRLLRRAIYLSKQDVDDLDAVHTLGQGWVAEETLAIAVYCALKYPNDFEKAIIAAVNHEGDSDSTGTIAGSIVGTNVGLTGIPDKFKDNLELYNVIVEMADDLYNDCKIGDPGYNDYRDDIWECKYLYRCYPRIKKSDDFWKEHME